VTPSTSTSNPPPSVAHPFTLAGKFFFTLVVAKPCTLAQKEKN